MIKVLTALLATAVLAISIAAAPSAFAAGAKKIAKCPDGQQDADPGPGRNCVANGFGLSLGIDDPRPTGIWGGDWTTKTGAGNCSMLHFNGNGETGSYGPSNGKITDGKPDSTVLNFRWEEDASAGGRYGGSAKFFLSPDGAAFSGDWQADDPGNGKGTWVGCRTGAPGCSCP